MKNKEEPSIDSTSGTPSSPVDRYIPRCVSAETPGSIVRQDGAASPSIEKPALSLFPESLMEAVVDQANVDPACEESQGDRSGKPRACAAKHHALIRGDLYRRHTCRRRSSE